MLKILHNIGDLDFSQILNVYDESLEHNAAAVGVLPAEQGVYDDLAFFLSVKNAACCVWELDERYVSCVRCEPYKDGVLLTCLETAPEERRKGYAFTLICELLGLLKMNGRLPAYVHIHNGNLPSIALHTKLGFRLNSDSARLVDGTVSTSYCTMKFE